MLTNLNSLHDLQSKFIIYIPTIIVTIIFTILPIKKNKDCNIILTLTLIISYIIILCNVTITYSPIANYGVLINEMHEKYLLERKIKDKGLEENEFLKYEISDYITYNKKLGKKPNIILIFTEGFSRHIIDDERNLTPNLQKYLTKSINFENYYNHTAATYRGIISQLYSGFQLNNEDKNNLISIESILKDNGYNTRFINTEPNNKDFTNYLNNLGFDEVLNQYPGDFVHDKEAYEQLFNTATELNKMDNPFFLSIYTFDTHVGLDSYDKIYNDGDNQVLNRIYNMDYQFGEFMEKFNKSKLYDNTIVIFTSDHASYTDADYIQTFTDAYKQRKYSFLDTIPFLIYHKGIEPKKIDASGRNSLDLVPTILDYIDVSDLNCFLGDSLFSKDFSNTSKFNYVYAQEIVYYTTKDNKITNIKGNNSLDEEIIKYYSFSRK